MLRNPDGTTAVVYPLSDEGTRQPSAEENWHESVAICWYGIEADVGGFMRIGQEPYLDGGNMTLWAFVHSPEYAFCRSQQFAKRDEDVGAGHMATGGVARYDSADGKTRSRLDHGSVSYDLDVSCCSRNPNLTFFAIASGASSAASLPLRRCTRVVRQASGRHRQEQRSPHAMAERGAPLARLATAKSWFFSRALRKSPFSAGAAPAYLGRAYPIDFVRTPSEAGFPPVLIRRECGRPSLEICMAAAILKEIHRAECNGRCSAQMCVERKIGETRPYRVAPSATSDLGHVASDSTTC